MMDPMKKIVVLFTATVIVLPTIPMVLWAFTTDWSYPDLIPSNFTFENFDAMNNVHDLSRVLLNSIIISAVVTLVSLILGIMPAKFIGTKKFRGKVAVQVLTMMPVMTPSIIVMFGLMDIFIKLDIYKTYLSLVLAEAIFLIPYMIMVLVPVFKNYDAGIDDQAATLGVNWLSRLMNITFPSIKSGLAVACMYVFMSSWATYLAVSLYAPRKFNTLASILYPAIKNGQYSDGYVAALTLAFFIPSVIFLVISTWIMGTDKVNNQRV